MLTQCPQCRTVFRAAPTQLRTAAGRVRCGQCNHVFDAMHAGEAPAPAGAEPQTTADQHAPGPQPDPLEDTAEHEILDLEVESTPFIEITMEGERVEIDGEDLPIELTADEPDGAADFILPSGTRVSFDADPPREDPPLPSALQSSPRRHRGLLWGAGSALLALAVLAQAVHFNREVLVRHPLLGNAVARVYERFGADLSPRWDLLAYELRQWGASADAQNGGTLHVRASLFNNAPHPQPYPLLRLTLQDRFGGQVGARDLTPGEYLPAPPDQLLGAGQRIDAQITIVDPGEDAVGFEIDVCLQRRDGGVVCAGQMRTLPAVQPR